MAFVGLKVSGAKYATRHFVKKKGSFTHYNRHEIRFITVMLQSWLSYTPVERQSVAINNSNKAVCDPASFLS